MLKPVKIGGIDIKNPIGLAPMAGISDKTYRGICLEFGAGFVCSEMISAKAIVHKNKKTFLLLKRGENEHPSAVQLFGSDPEALSQACGIIRDIPFDIIDFNMGCPMPKIVKNGEGSYLLTDLPAAEKAIFAIVSSAGKPVTIKIRSGFDDKHINAVEISKMAEACGVSGITIHARTRTQYYSGKANWNVIEKVKKAVSIPVFGNGDIIDGPSAMNMLRETGCDGITIGRAAIGNPWIFSQIRQYLEDGTISEKPSREEIFTMIIRHAKLLSAEKGEQMAIMQMRSHAAYYLRGFPGASKLRGRLNSIKSLKDLKSIFS